MDGRTGTTQTTIACAVFNSWHATNIPRIRAFSWKEFSVVKSRRSPQNFGFGNLCATSPFVDSDCEKSAIYHHLQWFPHHSFFCRSIWHMFHRLRHGSLAGQTPQGGYSSITGMQFSLARQSIIPRGISSIGMPRVGTFASISTTTETAPIHPPGIPARRGPGATMSQDHISIRTRSY